MAIEIGSLVVRGTFGPSATDTGSEARLKSELARLRRESARGELSGVILDLRNNGGGALTDAVGIAGLFIGEGPVVQVRNGDGASKVLRNYSKEVAYRGPLVVIGLVLSYAPGLLSWFGHLPGDIRIERENGAFYFPITSMIIVSIVLTVLFNLFFRR